MTPKAVFLMFLMVPVATILWIAILAIIYGIMEAVTQRKGKSIILGEVVTDDGE